MVHSHYVKLRKKKSIGGILRTISISITYCWFSKSVRGAYGGYLLAIPPSKISATDVIRVLEGPIQPVEGIEEEEPPQQQLWIRIRDAVKQVLDTTTIEDLANYTDETEYDGYMFYI